MKITIFRLKGVEKQLERIATALEVWASAQGVNVTVPKADTSGAAPEIMYTDEESDAIREIKEAAGQIPKPQEE